MKKMRRIGDEAKCKSGVKRNGSLSAPIRSIFSQTFDSLDFFNFYFIFWHSGVRYIRVFGYFFYQGKITKYS
jgi:hypothetical protein